MERYLESRFFRWLVYGLLILLALFLLKQISPMIRATYAFLRAVLAPFLIALIVSYVLNPIVNMLGGRKVPRSVAVLLIYASFIASVAIVLMNVTPMFLGQLQELNEHLPEMTMRAENMVNDIHQSDWLPDSVRLGIRASLNKAEAAVSRFVADGLSGIGTTINMLFIAFIIPFLAFYMLKDFQLIERTVLTFVPKRRRRQTIRLLLDIDKALGHYIRGQFLVCLIIGGLAYVGYWIIGMPYPLLLAFMVAVFNIIPYLGPFFGAAPAMLMASTISIKMMALVAIVNLSCQVLEGNVISPQVVGRSLHLHPLMIIFAVLVGGELMGIVGLILAVPALAVAKVVIHHWRLHYGRHRPV